MPVKTTITAVIQGPDGEVATSGYVEFRITPRVSTALFRIEGTGVIAPQSVRGYINVNGQLKQADLVSAFDLWGNDLIVPVNTSYTVVFAPNDIVTQTVPLMLISGATYDLSTPVFATSVNFTPDYTSLDANVIESNMLPAAPHVFSVGSAGAPYQAGYFDELFADNINLANPVSADSIALAGYLEANLPAAPTTGQMARVTNRAGGLWMESPTGWFSVAAEIVNLKELGAVGGNATLDTIAMAAAVVRLTALGKGELVIPRADNDYLIDGLHALPPNVVVVSQGRQGTALRKNTNGAMLDLGAGCSLDKVHIIGGFGAGKTGSGVQITSGMNQSIYKCRIVDCDSYAVEYQGATVGAFGEIHGGTIGNRDDPYVAILLPDDTNLAAPRCLSNIDTGGAVLCDTNGANNLRIDISRNNGIIFGANCGNVTILGGRIGGSTRIKVRGQQVIFTGVDFGLGVDFMADSISCQMHACLVPGWDITDLGTGNRFDIETLAYSPILSQDTNPQPVIGNGTFRSVITRHGKLVTFDFELIWGTTSTFGNNGSGYKISLLYPANNFLQQQTGIATVIDVNSNLVLEPHVGPLQPRGMFPCRVAVGPSESHITITDETNGLVRSDSPSSMFSPVQAFEPGDKITGSITYICL